MLLPYREPDHLGQECSGVGWEMRYRRRRGRQRGGLWNRAHGGAGNLVTADAKPAAWGSEVGWRTRRSSGEWRGETGRIETEIRIKPETAPDISVDRGHRRFTRRGTASGPERWRVGESLLRLEPSQPPFHGPRRGELCEVVRACLLARHMGQADGEMLDLPGPARFGGGCLRKVCDPVGTDPLVDVNGSVPVSSGAATRRSSTGIHHEDHAHDAHGHGGGHPASVPDAAFRSTGIPVHAEDFTRRRAEILNSLDL